MMMNMKLFFFFMLFLCISSTKAFAKKLPSEDFKLWCNKTPHPEPCKYFMSNNQNRYKLKHKDEFRKMIVHVAMERAMHDLKRFADFGPNCTTKCQKRAWSDCLKLHDHTIHHLNRTLQAIQLDNKSSTYEDAQTWLSTALTNIRTCHLSSQDLNVSDFISPIMSHNVTQLISNSLAVNGALIKESSEEQSKEFPSWISRHDHRKLLQSSAQLAKKAGLVVAKDGSGHFRTVQAAINASSKRRRKGRFVIYIKRGVYKENIEVGIDNSNIMLVGDGMKNTIITSDRSVKRGDSTYSSATAGIDGLHFIARDIAFINTAGPNQGQAVAVRLASDLSVFYRCSIEGYQDTLMVHSQRQFFRDCHIYGTVDFIFGNAAAIFQNSVIFVRKPLPGQANMITAQGREDPFQNTGIVIHNSQIHPAPELRPVVNAHKTYLGRPWQEYSRTVILNTYIDGFVSPEGWSRWGNSNFALNTLYYGEYRNWGPGASTRNRVKWRGFHVITSASEASKFTINSMLAGKTWIGKANVPFTSGL